MSFYKKRAYSGTGKRTILPSVLRTCALPQGYNHDISISDIESPVYIVETRGGVARTRNRTVSPSGVRTCADARPSPRDMQIPNDNAVGLLRLKIGLRKGLRIGLRTGLRVRLRIGLVSLIPASCPRFDPSMYLSPSDHNSARSGHRPGRVQGAGLRAWGPACLGRLAPSV